MLSKQTKIPPLVIFSALFVFLFTNLFSFFIFNHIPRVHDEIANLFQAKIFKLGKLYVTSPCEKDFFQFTHVINNGKWYSQYTPGYPLLLLIGLLVGAPWIVNPVLASISIIFFYFIGRELYSEKVGVLASVLGSISIWFLLMSSTMMSHPSSLFFTSFFLLFLFRSLKKPSMVNGLLAGAGWGMSFLVRPYNAVLISLPFLAYFSFKFVKDRKPRLKNFVALSLVILISISLLMVYNQVTNGHPLRMGYVVRYGDDHGLGFGKKGYTETPHTPLLGAVNVGRYIAALNKDLFGWPISSFLALLPLLWLTKIRPEERRKDLLLASGFFSLLIGLFFYWGTFVFIGARMCYETIAILILLSARGLTELPRLISLRFKKLKLPLINKAVVGVLIIFALHGFGFHLRKWVWPEEREWYFDGFAHDFAGVTNRIQRTIKSLVNEKSVVIIKFIYHPFKYFPYGWWGSGFLYNDPLLKGNVVYAMDRSDENRKIFHCFPERKIYLYFGTLEKGMLLPLALEGGKLVYGKPLSIPFSGKKYVELVQSPLSFYRLYSAQFRDFLLSLYLKEDFLKIDVSYLVEKGILCQKRKDYREASFCFEAALQVEKNPEVVSPLLNQLAACYLKVGEIAHFKKINEMTRNKKKPRIYNLIPERGI
ncbi:MAG: glycosyltransferase family 39 protein [Candidatus Aminicenantales bacterium]